MIVVRIILFCTLFIFSWFLSAQDASTQKIESFNFEKLEQLAIQSPKERLESINRQELENLNKVKKSYITAIAYRYLRENKLSNSIVQSSLKDHDFRKDSILFIKYLLILADLQKVNFEYEESLKNLYEVVLISRRLNEAYIQIDARISMGELNRATQNYELGLENLSAAEDLLNDYRGKDKQRLTARLYDRRSSIFIETKTFPDSIERMTLKSIDLAKKLGNIDLLAGSSNILGCHYLGKNPPNLKAELYLKQAMQLWDSIGFEIYAVTARQNLARFYLAVKKHQEAIEILLLIEENVSKSTWEFHEGYVNGLLGDAYEDMGAFECAIPYIRKANDLITQRQLINYNEKLSLYSVQLGVNEKEEEILRKETELELNALELNANNAEKNVLLLFLVVAALIVVLSLYFWYAQRSKKNLLFEKNQEIVQKNETIEESNVTLNKLLAQREDLLKEVNHRVKNNLTVLSSLLYLQSESLEGEEAKNALKISQARVHSIALIHESLYEQLELGDMDYQAYIEKLYNRIKSLYWLNEKVIEVNIQLEGYIPKLEESVPLGMILNELITNSFKYAFENVEAPQINIQFIDNSIVYFDNGPGFTPAPLSTSLGLKLISTFAIRLEAEVKYQNVEGFLQIIIQLP
ncbi:MAG: two-component sensor histidine kinase [Salibacteraceae bacterium]